MTREGARILVIEDDPTLGEILDEVLTDEGYQVRIAGDGQAGADAIDGWHPSVVLLDLMLPAIDAVRRRAEERADSAGWPRVLLVSASRDVEAAAAQLSADAWLPKPFRLTDLIEVVARLVDRPDR